MPATGPYTIFHMEEGPKELKHAILQLQQMRDVIGNVTDPKIKLYNYAGIIYWIVNDWIWHDIFEEKHPGQVIIHICKKNNGR